MRGQFLRVASRPRVTHTHTLLSPNPAIVAAGPPLLLLLDKKSCQSLSVHVDLVFATHFAADCACGAGGGSFCGDYFGSNGFSPIPPQLSTSSPPQLSTPSPPQLSTSRHQTLHTRKQKGGRFSVLKGKAVVLYI